MMRKRTFDLVVGSLLAVAVVPVVVVLAVHSAISFRAWPFFVQDRLGRDGRTFRILKLRSLPVSTPRYADKHQLVGISTTRLGRFLRAHHLDELPQLFLVPLGKMSLVGPRPEMPTLTATSDADFVALRSQVRPGCTGLWQVGAHSHLLIAEAPEYDLFYIHHRGFGLDLWILWRTVLMFLPRNRLVHLGQVPTRLLGPNPVHSQGRSVLSGSSLFPSGSTAATPSAASDL